MSPMEAKRGCGYRKLYRLYLVGEGPTHACDRLPYELKECPCCGFVPKQIRGFTWIHKLQLGKDDDISGAHDTQLFMEEWRAGTEDETPFRKCTCPKACPICYPDHIHEDRLRDGTHFGLMWVGKRWYSTRTFLEEALQVGVCKAINEIPKGLVLGKTWVLLAHPECQFYEHGFIEEGSLAKSAPREGPGIFYAFIPQRVEVLLPENEATPERVREYADRGITVVPVPMTQLEDHR